MKVNYKNKQLEKICTDAQTAERKYGNKMAEKIHQRIDEITAAESADMLVKFKIGRCHQLKGNRKNQYAMDLIHPYRLIFKEIYGNFQIAEIQEIVDYH